MNGQQRFFDDDELPHVHWPPDFNLEMWKSIGDQFVGMNKRLTDQLMWDIGDWLVEGEVRGGLPEKELKRYAEKKTERAWGTIKNWKMYSRRYPPSRRRDTLTHSLHVLVAKFDDATQENLLDMASEWQSRNKKPLPVRQFGDEIKRLQHTGMIPQNKDTGNGKGKGEPKLEEIKLWVSQADRMFFDRLAFAVYGRHTASELILDIVRKYWTSHRDEIKPKLEAFTAKAKDLNGPRPERIALPD